MDHNQMQGESDIMCVRAWDCDCNVEWFWTKLRVETSALVVVQYGPAGVAIVIQRGRRR